MQQAAPFFADDEDILMLYGDVPLISIETLTRLREAKPQGGIGLLTVVLDDPTGYGRITRENGNVTGIVEHKDASEAQRQIQEINTGILIANGADMKRWLSKLNNNNAQVNTTSPTLLRWHTRRARDCGGPSGAHQRNRRGEQPPSTLPS